MIWLLAGALGATGTLYFLLNLFWPGWYLDFVYRRANMRVRNALMGYLEQKKLLIDVYEDKVKLTPNKPFIICNDVRYSFEFMDKKANQVARACAEIGARPGSTIAVMIYNDPAIVWTYLGLMKAGYPVAFINFNLRLRPLSHSIKASGANFLIIGEGDALVHAVEEVFMDISDMTVYLQGPRMDQKPAQFLSFDTIVERMSADPIDKVMRKHVLPFSTNVLIYTSGTTGLPKPAIVPQIRCLSAGCAFNTFGMKPDDIIYEPLPMYHSAALLIGFGNAVTQGSTMVLRDKFSASHFWEDCRKYDVTVVQYIGEVCRYLVAQPKSKDDGIHKIKFAFGNGLRQDIWAEFQNRFKIPQLVEFYGATECPIGLSNITNKLGSCGRSSPYLRQATPAEFVKFDLEAQAPYRNKHGRCVPIGPDEVGLLIVPLIEGKTSFQGYKGRKEDTEKKLLYDVFTEGDKFFNTGDLLRVDREYYIYFNDRVGDTFRWKGENVSTTEVSNILTDLDFVHDANVYGVTIPGTDGRAGMAALHLNDQTLTDLTEDMLEALSKLVRDVLPVYARPRFIRIQRELEMTSTFKQQKTALVKEGYDVTKITDPVYYLNLGSHTYLPLDTVVYHQIVAKRVPL